VKRFLPLALLLSLLACQSVSSHLESLYADSVRERLAGDTFSTLGDAYQEDQEERLEKVRGYVKAEQLVTAQDYLYAGVILSSSSHPDDLTAAWAAGLKAAELGDDRGFRVFAEAVDRFEMQRGGEQKYGTQYYYLEVIQKWRLYPYNLDTTDAERAAMGVEPLAELLAREEQLNEDVR
jgi:hypothetical protein